MKKKIFILLIGVAGFNLQAAKAQQAKPYDMTINGVKQPDEVFKKYKAKYGKAFNGHFDYSRDGIIQGQ